VTETPPSAEDTAIPVETEAGLRGKVHVWLDWHPQDMARMVELASGYQELYPGVDLRLSYVSAETLREDLTAAREAGEQPTMVIASPSVGADLLEGGTLLDLSERVPPELLDELHPGAIAQLRSGDILFGLPVDLEAIVLYRNRLIIPDPADTVQNLVTRAKAATGIKRSGAYLDFGFPMSGGYAAACGGLLLTSENPTAFDGPIGVCWMTLLKRMSQAGKVGFNTDEDIAQFKAGRVGWVVESTARMWELAAAVGEANLAIDSWPEHAETGTPLAGFLSSRNLFLDGSLRGGDLEATWAFAVYLLAPDAQRLLATRADVQRLPALLFSGLEDSLPESARLASQTAVPVPLLYDLRPYARALERAASAVIYSGGLPDLALRRAVVEIRAGAPTSTPGP
jgi:maltose-binding protein MalE